MGPALGAALIGAGTSIGTGLLNAKSTKDANQANIEQSQAQMAFQERMSNTSHQREVADLKAAGLNPILSAHGGASSPGGAAAQIQPTDTAGALKSGISNAMAYKQLQAELENKRANTMLTLASENKTRMDTQTATTNAIMADNELIKQQAGLSDEVDAIINRKKWDKSYGDIDALGKRLGQGMGLINGAKSLYMGK